jgi:cytochrome c-type biogenesis protein CcmH
MILFWLICGVLIVIALAFILPPVLQRSDETSNKSDRERSEANLAIYRDQLAELGNELGNGIVSQEQYEQDREEIERRVLEDTSTRQPNAKSTAKSAGTRRTAYVLAVGLPLVSVVLYLKVGNQQAISQAATMAPAAESSSMGTGERSQQQIEANVAALAKRLQSNPSDAQGWAMLARSYNSMERFGEATGAYAKATELNSNDADLWAEYAFASAMANGRQLSGKPTELVNQALKVDPNNAKALQLAGSAAFEAKDYKKAIDYWQRVLGRVPPGSEVAQAITKRINEAKSLAK